MKLPSMTVFSCCFALTLPVFADDRPSHYEGEPAATLEQAVANFSEYNARLETILGRGELDSGDLHEVHRLTYTLENALEKLREEMEDLAEVLEEVHIWKRPDRSSGNPTVAGQAAAATGLPRRFFVATFTVCRLPPVPPRNPARQSGGRRGAGLPRSRSPRSRPPSD